MLNPSINELMEESLRSSHLNVVSVLERITDGFFVVDRQWRLMYLNRKAEEVAGKSREELLGKHLWSEYPQLKDTRIYQKYTKAMKEKRSDSFEDYLPWMDAWFETSLYPNNEGLSVFFRDITGKRRAQRMLRKNIRELRKTSRKLRQSNENLEQFATVASHDLKEPLRSISLSLQMFLMKHQESLHEESERYLDEAVKASKRMYGLIEGLLEVSRLGKEQLRFENFAFEDALKSASKNLLQALEEAGGKLSYREGGFPEVYGDRMQVTRVLQNLLWNAIKFRNSKRRLVIEFGYQEAPNPGQWCFYISDNGVGFDMDHAERIFQIFQRAGGEDVSGLGLGLAIAKGIVNKHEGNIWVESTPGWGSCFYFTLPKPAKLSS